MGVTWEEWTKAIADGVQSIDDDLLRYVATTIRAGGLVLTAGNGGSHALASHAAQAFMKPGYAAGGGKPAICLSDGVPTLTAHANDGGWPSALEEMAKPFLDGLETRTHAMDRQGVTLVLFSSSGKSENIVRLARAAKTRRHTVIAFTGFEGEPLKSLATISVHINSNDYEVVEPVHCAFLHRIQTHLRALT